MVRRRKCHVNWVICDSDWEAEFCRVAEAHPQVRTYVKNQNLGFEVPYLMGSSPKKYIPDFIVQINDGKFSNEGTADPLNLIVEIKGFRGENAKEKANTMRSYWVPGVNNLGKFGRWAFAEFTAVYEIESGFKKLLDGFLAAGSATNLVAFERAAAYSDEVIRRHFGHQATLLRFSQALWRKANLNPKESLRLTSIYGQLPAEADCDMSDALAVLALLSNRSTGLLRMELRSQSPGAAMVEEEKTSCKVARVGCDIGQLLTRNGGNGHLRLKLTGCRRHKEQSHYDQH